MSNHLMGYGSFGQQMSATTTAPSMSTSPSAMMMLTTAPKPSFATVVKPSFMKSTGPSPYIKQQVENLRGALVKYRSTDPSNLCKDPAFLNAFHPKGMSYACASQQARLNGSPFRQALRNTLETMKVKWRLYGGDDPKAIAAPLAIMIAQESDLTANDVAKYIGDDMQQVMGATPFRLATSIMPVTGGRAPVTFPSGGTPGGGAGNGAAYAPDEGFYAPSDEDLLVEADIISETEERAEEGAADTKKYLLWGLAGVGVLIGGYLLFGRKM